MTAQYANDIEIGYRLRSLTRARFMPGFYLPTQCSTLTRLLKRDGREPTSLGYISFRRTLLEIKCYGWPGFLNGKSRHSFHFSRDYDLNIS